MLIFAGNYWLCNLYEKLLLMGFPSSGGVPEGWGGLARIAVEILFCRCSAEKIATNSRIKLLKSMKKPLILITNDDGITAPGIRALIAVMSEIGDVVVN